MIVIFKPQALSLGDTLLMKVNQSVKPVRKSQSNNQGPSDNSPASFFLSKTDKNRHPA
jgi:hypothetical protein